MANRHRGEVSLALGGRRFTLRLTLQALAELEAAFSAGSLADLGARFGSGGFSSRDIATILGATLCGRDGQLDPEEVARLVEARDLPVVIRAIGDLFALNFGEGTAPPAPDPCEAAGAGRP